MKFSFYDKTTGMFADHVVECDETHLEVNTPDGHASIEGVYDHLSMRVDVAATAAAQAELDASAPTPEPEPELENPVPKKPFIRPVVSPVVVDHIPPAPRDNAMRTWHWDAASRRWASTHTAASMAERARIHRDTLLAACDWVVVRGAERGAPAVTQEWLDYRKDLRDITKQPGFPTDVTWPTPPA